MRKRIYAFSALTLLLALVTIGFVFMPEEPSPSPQEEEKVIRCWVSSDYMFEADLALPSEEWVLSKQFRRFEEENENVRIELSIIPEGDGIGDAFRTAALAGSGPDIVNLWTGQKLFSMKELLYDIQNLIPPRDLRLINGWESVCLDFKKGNPILGYPAGGSELYGFFYNKKTLAGLGVDLEKDPPQDPDQLFGLLMMIRDRGYLPIVADGLESNALFLYSFGSWWVQMAGTEHIAALSRGEQRFSEDEVLKSCLEYINRLYDNGLVNADYPSSQDALLRFVRGEALLLGGVGTSAIPTLLKYMPEDEIGFYTAPDYSADAPVKRTAIGGIRRSFSINANTKYPITCVNICSFLSEKKNQLEYLALYPQMPTRRDISAFDLNWVESSMMRRIFFLGQRYVYSIDYSLDTRVSSSFVYLGTLAVTGKLEAAHMASLLDEKIATAED